MARIRIDDLPVTENLTPEQEEQILGAGRASFRPGFEALENREMYAVNLGAALTPIPPPAALPGAMVGQVLSPRGPHVLGMHQAAGQQAPLLVGSKVDPLLAPTQTAADAAIQTHYQQWKKDFLRDGGNHTLRVARPENQEDTVSEGIGYGMLLAAYHGDKTTFDGLWAYAKSRLNSNGLMAWHIHQDGHTIDSNAATDADQDMAMALVVADKKWGGYQEDAKRLIGNILQHEVEASTNVLKPGDVWGGSDKTNPSYFAPAYYKAFQEYTGEARWGAVTDKAYEILDKAANPKTGLVPNWVKADGTPLDDQQYGYDAMRTPWRIALDAAWNGDPRAIAYLNKVNAFFKSVGVHNVKDKYNLDGSDPGNTWHNAAAVSMAATAAIVDADPAYRQSFWNETVNVTHEYNYYNESLRALSLLLIGNHMTKP